MERKDTADTQAKSERYEFQLHVYVLRALVCLSAAVMYSQVNRLQSFINATYGYLLTTWLFNSVYFETFFATFCYAVIIPLYPWLVDKLRCFDKFKIHPSVHYEHISVAGIMKMAVMYMAPLMLLDTFMVKKYYGVDPSALVEKRTSWLQTTRALPQDPPSVFAVVFQLIASFLLFDVLFFFVHLVLHKNIYLYNCIHKCHHEHDSLHSHVTNQLTVVERITLILSANFALKAFNSHPFTRMVFVPVFIGILVDNHAGYDMPFGFHRLVPFALVGGSVKHYQHHMQGKRYYQPILTYLDYVLENFIEH